MRIVNSEKLNYMEIDRTSMPETGHTVVVYEIWSGDRGDPATDISRRVAVFNNGDAPTTDEEWSFERGGYPSYHTGLKNSRVDEELEEIQKRDSQALQFRNEHERMTADPEESRSYYHYGEREDAKMYQAFLEAIDLLVENPEDAVAQRTIDRWRKRQALKFEK